jgi:DNA-binding IclR family transcriptional regulator
MRGEKMTEGVPGAQAIARAMRVLRAVACARSTGASLAQLVRETQLNKPTVHRLLLALVAEGMVEQEPQSLRYFVGRECYVLGTVADERFGLGSAAADAVARLAQTCGDSAFFSVRRDLFAVCVLREDGDYPLKTHVLQPGTRHPLGVGAGSLAMLAALDEAESLRSIEAVRDTLAERYPAIAIPWLKREVAATRARGYAVNEGKVVPGSWGVGVAIRGPDAEVVGALSVAAVEARLPAERQKAIGAELAQEAQRLERHLADVRAAAGQPKRAR